jgi:hypothetical protein
MKDWKWPAVVAFTVVVAGIVVMFGLTDDPPTRNHLIGYFDAIVPFIVGAAAGGTVGGAVGFAKGKGIL